MTRLKHRAAFVAPLLIALTLGACSSDKSSSSTTVSTVSSASTTVAASDATTTTSAGTTGDTGTDDTVTSDTVTIDTATGDTVTGDTSTGDTSTGDTTEATITSDTTPIASGDAASFCGFEKDIEEANTDVETEDQFIVVLKQFEPRMDQWIADAPNEKIKASAQAMVDATRASIAANGAGAFQTEAVNEGSVNITEFCGSESDG